MVDLAYAATMRKRLLDGVLIVIANENEMDDRRGCRGMEPNDKIVADQTLTPMQTSNADDAVFEMMKNDPWK